MNKNIQYTDEWFSEFSCMDKSEIKDDLELDWDGIQTWQYIHKK